MKSTEPLPNAPVKSAETGLVPQGITLGLALFAVVLSLAGFMPLPPEERPLQVIVLVFFIHVIGVPLVIWLGSRIMNVTQAQTIHTRNALSLGWLLSVVWMLWKMGTGV